jgi:hypothetical protein
VSHRPGFLAPTGTRTEEPDRARQDGAAGPRVVPKGGRAEQPTSRPIVLYSCRYSSTGLPFHQPTAFGPVKG